MVFSGPKYKRNQYTQKGWGVDSEKEFVKELELAWGRSAWILNLDSSNKIDDTYSFQSKMSTPKRKNMSNPSTSSKKEKTNEYIDLECTITSGTDGYGQVGNYLEL